MELPAFGGGYPSLALLGAGIVAVILGIRSEVRSLRLRPRGRGVALSMARGLRTAVLGLCLAGIGAGLYWQVEWVVAVSLTMLAVETLEVSVVLGALGGRARPRRW